ncbi:VOC family protein [Marinovum sp.]|uniref:VOC family protein n=1 Tax=Marinovum sp. TaxID=2024839 RepID=UPI003A911CB0
MTPSAKVATCLWFEKDGLEAARFYTSLLPGSEILTTQTFDHMATGEADGVKVITFTLAGAPFVILEAGPYQSHSDMVSILITTEDQAETDRLWHSLTADGGQGVQCGWLKDRWGITWQITPRRIAELTALGDRAKTRALMQAMQPMVKLDIAALEAAYHAG